MERYGKPAKSAPAGCLIEVGKTYIPDHPVKNRLELAFIP